MGAIGIEFRVAKVSAVQAITTIFSVFFQLISVPICLRYWGAKDYGHWLVIFAAFQIIRSFDAGFVSYVGNQLNILYNLDREKLREHLSSAIVGILLISVFQLTFAIGVIYSERLAALLGFSELKTNDVHGIIGLFILVGSWVLTGSYIGILNRLFIPVGMMYEAAWWNMAFQICNFFAIMVSAINDFNIVVTSVFFALSQSAIYLFSAYYFKLKKPEFFPLNFRFKIKTGLYDLKKSLWLAASNIVQGLTVNGTIVIVASVAGSAVVPVFTTIRTLANLWTNVTSVLTAPLLPDVVRFYTHNELRKLAITVETYWVVVGFAVNIGILLSYPILSLVFSYWTTGKIVLDNTLLSCLLSAVVTANFTGLISLHFNGINSVRIVFFLNSLKAVVSLPVGVFFYNYLGISSFGLGIFLAEIFSSITLTCFYYRYELINKGYVPSYAPMIYSCLGAVSIIIFLFNVICFPYLYWVAWVASLIATSFSAFCGWKKLDDLVKFRFLALIKNRI